MADFGWAFVKGGLLTGSANPSGSVQFNNGSNGLGGSSDLVFISGSTSQLNVTGAIIIQGHISASSNISASAFYGDGSNLTGITTSPAGGNGEIQFNNAGNFDASSNLTFDGSSLVVLGDITASVNISASAFYGDGSNLTGITSVNIANDAANRVLTADGDGTMTAQQNFTFNGSVMNITGTLNVSGTINANELNIDVENRTVVNISKTGSTNFGDSSDDLHRFTGSVDVTGDISGSGLNLSGLASGTAVNISSYLAIDSNNNIILTSSSGGGIGEAEDGDYTDGLFTDFTAATPVGVPIDRFNEVLKILAPSPAPALSRANYDNIAGETVKLSFGASSAVTNYRNSNTQAGFDALDITDTYQAETSGSNFRLGVYDGSTSITGYLNFNVAESSTNGNLAYSNDAFGNAETGSLKIEMNGAVLFSINLGSTVGAGNPNSGSASSVNGYGSGFTNISVTASSFDGNGADWYIFKHRTAKFNINPSDMVPGWNYARIVHSIGSTTYATNYIEWINDPSGSTDDLYVSNARIENITLTGSRFLSGVEYNTDATANYKVDIHNMYRNVYASSGTPISFTTTRATTPTSQAVPDIDFASGEDNTKILRVTASLDQNQTVIFNNEIVAYVSAQHPFKSSISLTGSATTGNGFLIDTRTTTSTNTNEYFHDEGFRKASASYDSQSDVTNPSNAWNSQNHMTSSGAAGHEDGLLCYNQNLYSPISSYIVNSGNFGGIPNTSPGQPDYSTTTGIRTYYRAIQNTSGQPAYNMRVYASRVNSTYVSSGTTLGTNTVKAFIKIPGSTGWMDVSQNFVYGNTGDNDGAAISGLASSTFSYITFGTASIPNGGYVMLKYEASSSWNGYLNNLSFVTPYIASQQTPQVLSDIDVEDAGQTVKLSFGASNPISGYQDVSASMISLVDLDTNEVYEYTGTESDRRGAFAVATTINGILNDAIASGTGYTADAFYNGYSGSLVLEVNGIEVHSSSLDSTMNAISNDFNGNSSGFDLSEVKFSTVSGVPSYIDPYRTGTYQIGPGDQVSGWNYARVIHRTSSDQTTNYVEWVYDPSGSIDNTSVSSPSLTNFNHANTYYQSGIGYFASSPTASISFSASNFYSNVYKSGSAISFPTTTNCAVQNIRVVGSGVNTFDSPVSSCDMPSLNNTANCELTSIQITGTLQYDGPSTSISGGLGLFTSYNVVATGRVEHPFKSARTTSVASKNYFMIYSGSNGSTDIDTQEHFNTEAYRILSGNYATQLSTTSSANSWDSSVSMNDGVTYPEYNDGLVTVNGYLISPLKIGNAGDTRNITDGGTLQSPSGNPNYSTSQLSESVRTYYRYFKNSGPTDVQNFSIYVEGDSTIVAKQGSVHYGALGANNRINIEMKVPGQTAWGDVAIPQGGVDPTVDGYGIFNGGNGNLDQDTSDGSDVDLTLGTLSWPSNDYIVLKISAHKDWTGYLTQITASY